MRHSLVCMLVSSLSQCYSVISPGSYISPSGGKKKIDKMVRLSSETHCRRWQSALVIMTDFGWNWLPTCDDKLFNFPPAQPPLFPLRLHFASSGSDRAAAADSVIRILNQAKLVSYLGAARKLPWHSTVWSPTICCCCHRHYRGSRQDRQQEAFQLHLFRMAEATRSHKLCCPHNTFARVYQWAVAGLRQREEEAAITARHSAGHSFTPSHFFLLMLAWEWVSHHRHSCCLIVSRWQHPKRVREWNGNG